MNIATTDRKRNYYKEGIEMLFSDGENFNNYNKILSEYEEALINREKIIDGLYQEIKIIKKLRV